MNDKLIDTKILIHKDRIIKLNKIENELIEMIFQLNNEKIMNKFLDWQNMRKSCNDAYSATMNVLLNDLK